MNNTSKNTIWLHDLLANLDRSGSQGHLAWLFLTDRKIRLGFHNQPTGARWTVTGLIQLHPRYAVGEPDSPYALSLIIHEVRHLQQGWITALSVRGELEAWQEQFRFLKSLTGYYNELPYRDKIIGDLMSFSSSADRQALSRARDLMQAYAGDNYRVDLLPIYPLDKEIFFLLTGGK